MIRLDCPCFESKTNKKYTIGSIEKVIQFLMFSQKTSINESSTRKFSIKQLEVEALNKTKLSCFSIKFLQNCVESSSFRIDSLLRKVLICRPVYIIEMSTQKIVCSGFGFDTKMTKRI